MISRFQSLIAGILFCVSTGALSQTRPIPDDVQRGWLRHVQETQLSINNAAVQLAPGGIIRNERNLIVVPASLPGEGALAEYQLDASGQLIRAWLLTPDEAARQWPRR
jgi:hypothetical protein